MKLGFEPQLQEFGLYSTSNKIFMKEVVFSGKPAFHVMLKTGTVSAIFLFLDCCTD